MIGPILLFFISALILSRKPQHAIIRSHPYLGWVRYVLEKVGPEFRQYWFDGDEQGRPFSRSDFLGLVFSAKYRSDLISFGSKRNYEDAGFYLANAMFPLLTSELQVDNSQEAIAKKYVVKKEGLFSRREELLQDHTSRWLYTEKDAIVVGPLRTHPWRLYGMFGASATSYGSVGEHYILSTGMGVKMAGGSWMNTGEGGVAPEHLQTGADIIAQIGPGLFGYRTDQGEFSWEEFSRKAQEPQIKAFELKFGQGAKIRGGHLEGSKVNAKVAQIRKVPIGQTVNSPNRFPFLRNAKDALEFIAKLQQVGGKPVGIKIVVGQQRKLEELFEAMIALDVYPDFITVDGGDGGSGATFKSMADTMGLPLYSALLTVVDTAYAYGIRDHFRIFASGRLIAPDKVAIALAMGADAVNSARGFMMANGCIMAMQCHTGKCPTGVTTTDLKYQSALVPDEKKWRVMNYILTMRSSLYALAAAAGLDSPRKFTREHVIYKNEYGRSVRLSDLFPLPGTLQPTRHAAFETSSETRSIR
ncbi:FMN-binding glutamate synthase family protein [Sulfoacidibacillus thermotolerans]|uniref:FMN-binding glutamate synthase family protein n=1 Tax=Sulfoacidibacillus thermotolerans TaxID=1765684 RepID=A0A2U3DCL0_SULT2|nr:FMN-binding glutamate synthase family protein [Sulfoacidibacillus thermotolerans]PWI59023.1 FMN-binding glutamate synthase family protein [Sulfoacidibacillus thermotolerans]